MAWEIVSTIVAILSLVLNYFQYKKNKKLSGTQNLSQNTEGSIDTSQQSHTGEGDNISIKGDSNFSK